MKIEVDLIPFRTPNFVRQKLKPGPRQDGFTETPTYSLKDLDAETLSGLCDQFRKDVFKCAKKDDPKS